MTHEGPPVELRANAGEEAVVALDETPSSGYRWELRDVPDELELVADDYLDESPGLVGGGGMHVFRLATMRPGEYRFEAALRRAWEEEALEVRRVAVVVDPTA